MFNNLRLSKNEDCPCGSDMKYKECCLNRPDENIDASNIKKVLHEVAVSFDAFKYETCLHPNRTECKPPIKWAHSIQNHGVLSQIAHENHVMTFSTKKTKAFGVEEADKDTINIIRTPERIGVNNATIHTCFCNYHDSTVFRPIESNPNGFISNNNEQLFIYAYKAFAFEYYKTQVSLIAVQNLFRRIPQKFRKYPFLFVPNYRQTKLKSIEFDFYKNIFDEVLINNKFDELYTVIIEIPFKIEFSSIDCISPNFDMNGKRIKTYKSKLLRRIFMNIFPNGNKSYILLSCIKSDEKIFNRYFNQMKESKSSNLYEYLSVLLPLYSENIVLNPLLWDKWKEEGQFIYSYLTNLHDSDLLKYERVFAFALKNKYKRGIEIPASKCNLFERV